MGGLIDKDLQEKIKTMSLRNLELLTYEIRDFLISNVDGDSGHLASNLGVVELTLALHRVFDVDLDRIVWDAGHQVCVHKILTGRAETLKGPRQYGGDDASDVYSSGHGSASISAAMGLAEARDIMGEDHHVVAVIGDGALTGGLAYEGLNNAGNRQTRMIVVLNDNDLSVSEGIGSVAQYLSKLRTSQTYQSAKHALKERMARIPRVGESMVQGAERMKNLMRYAIVPGTLFEELGFNYYGPVDGNNLGELIELFDAVKQMNEPVLVHVLTKKGAAPIEHEAGPARETKGRPWSLVAGDMMMELAERDQRIVCISAAMTDAVGLSGFSKSYFRHFFDVGVAEEHAVTFAAGLALGGMRPFVFIYSTFLQRAYDQIMLDVSAQKLPVVFMVDQAGGAGGCGEAHHGVFDLSYLCHIPGLVVMAPKDAGELKEMIEFALSFDGPCAIRYPGGEAYVGAAREGDAPEGGGAAGEGDAPEGGGDAGRLPLETGVSERLTKADTKTDAEIFALGKMARVAALAAEILEREGIHAGVVNARFAAPVDEKAILGAARGGAAVVTLEDNALQGGFGERVCAILASNRVSAPVLTLGWPDEFAPQGGEGELMAQYGLDAEGVASRIRVFLGERTGMSR